MRNYHKLNEAPLNQSSMEIKHKREINSRSSLSGSIPKNPEVDFFKLPSLQNSNNIRRSSSLLGTDRNTKFRLQSL